MKKELKLKKSVRSRRRYLLIEGDEKETRKAILDYIGILGWAKSDPVFIKGSNEIILAINREKLMDVRASLLLSENEIKVKGISGTLKGLKNKSKV